MPSTRAVSGLWAAASIWRPVKVRRRNSCRTRITTMLTARTPRSSAETAIPPGRQRAVPNVEGNCSGRAPNSTLRYSRIVRAKPRLAMTSGMSSPPGTSSRSTSETLNR
jgi:hypothetical protein